MARKTVPINRVKEMANGILLHTPDDHIPHRATMIAFIENLLLETKNYKGFRYLDTGNMQNSANGVSVGINDTDTKEVRFTGTDHTRVHYF